MAEVSPNDDDHSSRFSELVTIHSHRAGERHLQHQRQLISNLSDHLAWDWLGGSDEAPCGSHGH